MDQTPLRILIVEDDHDSARMLRVLLKRSGHEAQVAYDGPAALAAAREFAPRVVLVDQTLEGMSGTEVASQLRAIAELVPCTIVAVSGHGKDLLPSPSPFDGHFQKPIDHEALLEFLASVAG